MKKSTKRFVKKNAEEVSWSMVVITVIIAILLSSLITLNVVKSSQDVKSSLDQGKIIVDIPGNILNQQGKIIVEIKGNAGDGK